MPKPKSHWTFQRGKNIRVSQQELLMGKVKGLDKGL